MYNKSKCQSCVRQVIVLETGTERVKLIIAGQHAFQYSITCIKSSGVQHLVLPNRKACMNELNKCKLQYRNHGTVRLAV